ncbi:uncharacterized protein LOC120676925 [Panicum virgatum]|uniref:Uncharacterized protein n=1 Tax=Panicum virgatum TaxID=38727 RepID=A0A8T0RWY3_PANVG|nr:uncharacterized protein LOC120676925 [Panicum virgatum]KAG2590457.1 hypothetical protein PVAP13_5NG404000 [Panicum virgatum]
MEAEAFPIRFTKGIRSYWRRRDYQPADGAGAASRGRRRRRLVRLGDGSGPRPWAVRLGGMFRVKRRRGRAPAPAPAAPVAKAPMRVLGRIRDAYVDVMLGAAKTQPAAARAPPTAAGALWKKRVPTRRSSSKAQQKADELGQRLVMEMYKSVLASRNVSGMLRASVAR